MTAPQDLRSYVERIEVIETEIKDRNEDKRDIYAEAKATGFDVPALKAVIARRRKDPGELTEHEDLVNTYEAALGTGSATRAPAREAASTAAVYSAVPIGSKFSSTLSAAEADLEIPPFLKRA